MTAGRQRGWRCLHISDHNEKEAGASDVSYLHAHVRGIECVHVNPCSISFYFLTLFCPSYPTHRYSHSLDATMTTAMCTVNFKELKRSFRKHVTHMSSGKCVHATLRLLCDLFERD